MCVNILSACVVAAGLTGIDVGYDSGFNSTAYSYDGVARDVSRFYDDKQTNYHVSGIVVLDDGSMLSVGYDNGIRTTKYRQGDSLSVYGVKNYSYGQHDLSIGGGVRFNGNQTHTPCIDGRGVQYYCEDLTLWNTEERNDYNEQDYSFKLTYRFNFSS